MTFAEIPDELLRDTYFKDRGLPLKGKGYVSGVFFENGYLFLDLIMTDNFYAHVKVQCDEQFCFNPTGKIKFPPSWDTEEKKEKSLLKSFKFLSGDPLVIKKKDVKEMYLQYTIFDFL